MMFNRISRKVVLSSLLVLAVSAMNAETVVAALQQFAAPDGPSFIKYDEAEKCKDAKTLTGELTKQKDLMCAVLGFGKAVPKSVFVAALDQLFEENNSTWKLSDDAKADWLVTISRRLANSQHVMLLAKNKTCQPKWLLEIQGNKAPAQVEEPKWEYGFCRETKCAYRVRVNGTNVDDAKDLAVTIATGADHEPIIASFADNSSIPIAEITSKTYIELTTSSKRHDESTGVLWRGEHVATKNNLRVQHRNDRGLLVSLYEQSLQVCQVHVDAFETAEWKQENRQGKTSDANKYAVANTKPARQAAEQFMVSIGKAYAIGSIKKEDLYAERDKQLQERGLATGRKRKAADTSSASSAKAKASAKEKAKAKAKAKGALKAKPTARRQSPSRRSQQDKESDESEASEMNEEIEVVGATQAPFEEEPEQETEKEAEEEQAPRKINVSVVAMPLIDMTSITDQI